MQIRSLERFSRSGRFRIYHSAALPTAFFRAPKGLREANRRFSSCADGMQACDFGDGIFVFLPRIAAANDVNNDYSSVSNVEDIVKRSQIFLN